MPTAVERLEVDFDTMHGVTNALGPLLEEFNQATAAFSNAYQALTWVGQTANAANAAINNNNIPGKLTQSAKYLTELQDALNRIMAQVEQNDSNGAAVMSAAMGDGSV
ncbi:MAG TPA: hypothetical protein VMT34_02590 [Aggregatilineales bacterium]|nr:hypothetical protein [Aggregatilineales bacterium]